MEGTNKYYKGIQLETSIITVFQSYLESKKKCKSFLKIRPNKQASIDYLGRLYNDSGTIKELAVEVRSLSYTKGDIEEGLGYIMFPISKLNELMQFWRMEKEVYIVYLLGNDVFFLKWDYYLKHNFEIQDSKKGYFVKLPIRNFIYCGSLME